MLILIGESNNHSQIPDFKCLCSTKQLLVVLDFFMIYKCYKIKVSKEMYSNAILFISVL